MNVQTLMITSSPLAPDDTDAGKQCTASAVHLGVLLQAEAKFFVSCVLLCSKL